jgi:IclR family transcriptional regulator, mhp operon transcriptional activator
MSASDLIANGKLRARRRNRAVREKTEATQGAALVAAHCRTNSHRGSTDFNVRSYPTVESIARGLHVLRTVSKFHIVTIGDIFAETKIPKPTIVRVLETLISEGYVARDNLCGGYRITSKANELGLGYNGISQIIETARPIAVALTERTQWPVGIGTPDNDAIWLRFSTAALCKRATAVSLGWRLDLFYTAMGRAYLAFCTDAERERVFKARLDAGVSARSDEAKIRELLPEIREKGFAARGDTRTVSASSVAAPIFGRGTLLAVVNLSYFKEAARPHTLRAEAASSLLETRAKIEAAIQLEQQPPARSENLTTQLRASHVAPIKLENDFSSLAN